MTEASRWQGLAGRWRAAGRRVAMALIVPLGLIGLMASPPALAASAQAAACPPAPQPFTQPEIEDGQRRARNRGFLFRVRKEDRESYLYGTTHVGRRDWVFLGPRVVEALESVDRVALELDLSDADVQQRLQAGVRRRVDAPPLPAALAQRLGAALTAACADDLGALRPEFQALTLITRAFRADGLDPAYGIDPLIADVALDLGKPVAGLETPEQQLDFLVRDDPQGVADMVSDVLDELARPQTRLGMQRLMQAWDESDLLTLQRYESWCDCLHTPLERQQWARLLDDRNPAMAEQIIRWHDAGERIFVAVGALHLVGERGLPALLGAQGFVVERVLYPRQ